MSLLELEHVHKSGAGGRATGLALRDACCRIEAGELAVAWAARGAERSLLLRIAAGIEPPDRGTVLFEGLDLALHGERLLGSEIGYAARTLPVGEGQSALEHAMAGPLSHWASPRRARTLAGGALQRTGAAHCARMPASQLAVGEAVRVALARALALGPRLLVIDDPVRGVDVAERDPILALLRSLADEGLAVLAGASQSTALSEADRALYVHDGELGSVEPERAQVLPFPARPRPSSGPHARASG